MMHLLGPCRLPVDHPDFWCDMAGRVAETIPADLQRAVAADLREGAPGAVRFARDAAKLAMRAIPGRLSLARGLGDALLILVALELNPAAGAAYRQRLLAELENCCGKR